MFMQLSFKPKTFKVLTGFESISVPYSLNQAVSLIYWKQANCEFIHTNVKDSNYDIKRMKERNKYVMKMKLCFTETNSFSEEHPTLETDEEMDESSDIEDERGEEKGNNGQEWKSPGFKFEADAMEDQRILDIDEVVLFESRPLGEVSSDVTPEGAGRRDLGGGFQFQNAHRIREKIKQIIRRELNNDEMMSQEEATQVII